MHLASFRHGSKESYGIRLDGDRLLDLPASAAALGGGALPRDLKALIAAGSEALDRVRSLAAAARESEAVDTIAMSGVQWLPPVPRPGKIIGVAMNNRASDARKISAPDHPMFFMKPTTCLVGHLGEIEVRPHYGSLHPEPELAVVISRRARDLDPAKAYEAVFGYTIFNDITGNAMRAEDMVHYYALYGAADDPDRLERREQHLSYAARYKGTDGFGPMGPWLVTRDAVPDPHALDVTCTVGGEIVAQDSTKHLRYLVPEILAFLSRYQTLEPGDVISMGTAFKPAEGAKRSLHTADLSRLDGPVEVSITGLGTLTNTIRRSAAPAIDWRLP
jgi:2-keto-4-pentenoate hydratase/2-oxohepta-3-ene-1,7-dioic acid hydratase in catechol pathway